MLGLRLRMRKKSSTPWGDGSINIILNLSMYQNTYVFFSLIVIFDNGNCTVFSLYDNKPHTHLFTS